MVGMIAILSTFVSALSFRLRSRASLELELIALRHQVSVLRRQHKGRLRLFTTDRLLWIWLYRIWPRCLDAMVLVKPTTVIHWHHRGFRLYWRRRSRPLGRPRKSTQIRDLIRRMSMANPLWGAPRIHGELLRLGIAVCQATVGRYMPWWPKAPSPTWRSFLHNHMREIAAIDMFVVVTSTFRLLYTLIVLGHDRCKVIHFDITQNPTQVWLARQMTEAFPWDTTPRFLLRDRDSATARSSVTGSRQWVLRRSLPRHDPRGRTPMWSASSARSAANVSITSSSSMSVTCAVCCRRIFNIITAAGHIFRSTRIVQSLARYSRPLREPLSPSHRWVACTIATNGALRELLRVT